MSSVTVIEPILVPSGSVRFTTPPAGMKSLIIESSFAYSISVYVITPVECAPVVTV